MNRRRLVLASVCLLAPVIAAFIAVPGSGVLFAQTTKPAPLRRFAIAPLKNLRPNTDTDWIGPGVAETLTTKLTGVPGLLVIERSQVAKVVAEQDFQKLDLTDAKTAAKLGKVLGAERILVGSYAKSGDKILFNVRVVDVEKATVLSTASLQTTEKAIFESLFKLANAVIESFDKKVVVVNDVVTVTQAPKVERIILTEAQVKKLKEWGTTSPDAYEALCKAMAAAGPAEAIRWLDQAIALDRGYAFAYFGRGTSYGALKKYDEAIRDLTKAIELEPKEAKIYFNRACVYNYQGKYDKAMRDYTKAIKLDPKAGFFYYERAQAYSKQSKYEQALRDYTKAIELDPKAWRYYRGRASVYLAQRKYDQVISENTKVIELDPSNVYAHNERGIGYHRLGKYDEAIREYTKAIKLTPQNPKFVAVFIRNRGKAYYNQGKHDKAIQETSEAIRLYPKLGMAYEVRAQAYFVKGDYKKAWADVKEAQKLGIKFEPAFLSKLRKASGRQE